MPVLSQLEHMVNLGGWCAGCRECEKATLEAEERKIQASILMDTVETLQVGSDGEAAQRVLALTAQLVTARTREVMLERRAAELLVRGAPCRRLDAGG
jgi:hypothetical protein